MSRVLFAVFCVLVCLSFNVHAATVTICGGNIVDVQATGIQQVFTNYSTLTTVLDTFDARSNLECITKCSQNGHCAAVVFRERDQSCDLLDGQQDVTQYSSSEKTGILVSNVDIVLSNPLRTDQSSGTAVCSEWPCTDTSRCREDCTSGEAVCLGYTKDCDEAPVTNIHYEGYASNFGGVNANGPSYTYVKQQSSTGLRISYSGTIRAAIACNGCASGFYFKINGAECSNPGTIEFVEYHASRRDKREHGSFSGICWGIAAGTVTIQIHIRDRGGGADALMGWNSYGNFAFEEIGPTGTGSCDSYTLFNIKEFTLHQEISTRDENAYMTETYTKRASDTSLAVFFTGTLHEYGNGHCARWYFKFNGNECSNPGVIDAFIYNHGDNNPHTYRTFEFSGICHGFPAGDITISLHTGSCSWTVGQYSPTTGWTTISRIRVEETRLGVDVSALVGTSGISALRLPVFNRQYWWYSAMNTEAERTTLKTETYSKKSALTALRVLWSGVTRQWNNGQCARWYFTFNGTECSNPGTIESIKYTYYYDASSVNLHSPFTGILEL
ncbi:uncharacterized protein LOC106156679 [Lingula anatina]|uniref:Uncharacterized protein LOC106156679 n=1 Tax=Lingula anatina TaxID=7574 RepID=A0A1S3HR32_LINAN|nr:uncharacterized protein LOC106156679 [Lingula anatina]|eukprot:XP_013387504.1 uncharacterized protein LOC106156679 [Lingula anatina]